MTSSQSPKKVSQSEVSEWSQVAFVLPHETPPRLASLRGARFRNKDFERGRTYRPISPSLSVPGLSYRQGEQPYLHAPKDMLGTVVTLPHLPAPEGTMQHAHVFVYEAF